MADPLTITYHQAVQHGACQEFTRPVGTPLDVETPMLVLRLAVSMNDGGDRWTEYAVAEETERPAKQLAGGDVVTGRDDDVVWGGDWPVIPDDDPALDAAATILAMVFAAVIIVTLVAQVVIRVRGR